MMFIARRIVPREEVIARKIRLGIYQPTVPIVIRRSDDNKSSTTNKNHVFQISYTDNESEDRPQRIHRETRRSWSRSEVNELKRLCKNMATIDELRHRFPNRTTKQIRHAAAYYKVIIRKKQSAMKSALK